MRTKNCCGRLRSSNTYARLYFVQLHVFDFGNKETYAGAFQGILKMFLMRPPQISNIKRDMVPALEAAKQPA